MFPHSQAAEGSIPRPGNPRVAFACSPSIFQPQKKDEATEGCWQLDIVCQCECQLSVSACWPRDEPVTHNSQVKQKRWYRMDGILFLLLSTLTNHSPCMKRTLETRRRQPLWLAGALCMTTSAQSVGWHTRCKWKAKQNSVERGWTGSIRYRLPPSCPMRLNRPTDVRIRSSPAVLHFQLFLPR